MPKNEEKLKSRKIINLENIKRLMDFTYKSMCVGSRKKSGLDKLLKKNNYASNKRR